MDDQEKIFTTVAYYADLPNIDKYKNNFIQVVARCMRTDVGANQLQHTRLFLHMVDLLNFIVGKTALLVLERLQFY